jgi:hypothetical protein
MSIARAADSTFERDGEGTRIILGGSTHSLIGNEVVLSTVRRPDRRTLAGDQPLSSCLPPAVTAWVGSAQEKRFDSACPIWAAIAAWVISDWALGSECGAHAVAVRRMGIALLGPDG